LAANVEVAADQLAERGIKLRPDDALAEQIIELPLPRECLPNQRTLSSAVELSSRTVTL
jgi:hypothetical protein